MILGFVAAKATAPIASEAVLSVFATQLLPPSRVSQTPPCAAPISQWLGFGGSTGMLVTRPLLFTVVKSGCGPSAIHLVPGTPPDGGSDTLLFITLVALIRGSVGLAAG